MAEGGHGWLRLPCRQGFCLVLRLCRSTKRGERDLDALLVPLDESPAAETGLKIAAALALVADMKLILVRGPDRPPAGVRPFEVSGGAVSYAEEYLAGHADRLKAQGLRVETATLPEGPIAQLIIDEAK